VFVGFAVLGAAPPVLITLLLLFSRLAGPATLVQNCTHEFIRNLSAYEKIKALERDLQPTEPVKVPKAALGASEGPIVFRDVDFRHFNREPFDAKRAHLSDINLTIAPGSFTGIAGASGAGKTTFADLLVGLISPSRGEILIGGIPLGEVALSSWRQRISYVSQDPFLFHDTIRKNLLWANPRAAENDLLLALETAGADAVVGRMSQGLDTVVGERGILVSGGERQRIALACALVRKPRLLVLDEATNAIDVAGERAIIERILELRPRMTIVVIAHRTESLSLCDRVFVFASGRICAEGSFAALRPHLHAFETVSSCTD
jgi:ATP-binding cassette subfamily C protein